MPNDDTIKLLKECDAGAKMGIEGIKNVIDKADNKSLIALLEKYLKDHEKLEEKIHEELNKFHDEEKNPSPIAKAMSWVKINMKLVKGENDPKIADLMIEG